MHSSRIDAEEVKGEGEGKGSRSHGLRVRPAYESSKGQKRKITVGFGVKVWEKGHEISS